TRMIDARDRVVAPGFIDIHSHSDNSVFVNDAFESALHMGVTLVVCGNCGGSSAPVSGLAAEELDRSLAVLDARRTWTTFAQYADAGEENLEIGRRSHVRVQLSHHKASGPKNWGRVKESTANIEAARDAGVDVQADQYPYTASSTGLAVTIPNWAHEGGRLAMCERLKDPAVRARIRDEYVETGRNWDRIVIAR